MGKRHMYLAAICTGAIALAGCGDDSGDDSNVVGPPEASGSVEDHLTAVNSAIADGDCEAFVAEAFSQRRTPPPGADTSELPELGREVNPVECDPEGDPPSPAPGLLAELKGTEFEEVDGGEAGLISQGEAAKPIEGYDHWSMFSIVDRDGALRHTVFIPVDPQDEEPNPDADPVGVVEDQLLPAVRENDCKDAKEFYDPNSAQARGSGDAVKACEELANGSYFAPSLRDTPEGDVEVEEVAFVRDGALVGVRTKEAYYTVALVTPVIDANKPPQAEFLVSDVLLGTEAEPG